MGRRCKKSGNVLLLCGKILKIVRKTVRRNEKIRKVNKLCEIVNFDCESFLVSICCKFRVLFKNFSYIMPLELAKSKYT